MGLLRRAWDRFTLSSFAADETPPRPIAEVLLQMNGMGLYPRATTREALSVAPVLRARNLICSIATLPLIQYDAEWNRVRFPLLEQIDPDVANVITLAQTVQDLMFEGVSWWWITASDYAGYPFYARHLEHSSVSLNPPGGHTPAPLPGGYDPRDAVIYHDGHPIPAAQVIRFDSPNPGLLNAAGRIIQRAVLLDTTSALYANNPRPQDFFTPADGADPADSADIQKILDDWQRARKTRSTAYVGAALKYNAVDTPTPAELQLVELQRKAALDLANATGLDPEDLGISTTSRTYQNGVDRRQDRINDVLAPYMAAITQRLSMPDVTKRGKRVEFDLDNYLKADPKTRWETYKIAKDIGAMDADEIRAEEKRPALTISQKLDLAPPAPADIVPPTVPVKASADDHLHLSFATQFAVHADTRIIEGTVVPYGPHEVAAKNGQRWRFQQGSLVPSEDISRNKLLRDHDFSQPQGPLVFHDDGPTGMFARYKVGRGPDGDRTLAEAQDKVRDGFSVGVDINDYGPDPLNPGAMLVAVGGAVWYETSVLAVPAFDGARVTRVAATKDNGGTMDPCATCGQTHADGVACPQQTPPPVNPPPAGLQLSQEQQQALLAAPGVLQALIARQSQPAAPAVPDGSLVFSPEQVSSLISSGALGTLFGLPATPPPAPEQRPVVDPTRRTPGVQVREEAPYRFDRKGNLTRGAQYDFSSDVIAGLRDGDKEALGRAERFMRERYERAEFVTQADAATLNPNIQRPDMYVDQKEFQYPFWSAVDKGSIADATPFVLPKFSSSSGLVAGHVENTEPTPGTFVATAQTITPSPNSGKVEISREAWDQGGNPQLSGLIWRQMERAWFESLEAATVTLLEAAAPTTFTITTAAVDGALEASLSSQLATLAFARGGFRMRDAVTQVDLYKALIGAKDSNGRKLFPMLTPTNASGNSEAFYQAVFVQGLMFKPGWALAATGVVSANSYVFDRNDVSGWATAPQRLTFENIAVAKIHMGIWGYKALAITDLTGVRRLAYDPV